MNMEIDILGKNDTRSGFGAGLSYLGETNPNVVALCADLTGSLKMNDFQNKFIVKNLKSISFYFPDPWFKKRHYKRRVIQPGFINILSNSLQKGTLIFIKTDVKDLFDYMDCTISSNFHFKTIDKKDFNCSESFNPIKVKTDREKYVIVNQLDIYEKIYIKI